MYSSSLHFNLIMSIFCETTHVLLKLNLFPYTDVAHACHMISARWCFVMREWELANNDGIWISTRRVVEAGEEHDMTNNLMKSFEDVHSITIYHFTETDGPTR